jgi:hypothetical protein
MGRKDQRWLTRSFDHEPPATERDCVEQRIVCRECHDRRHRRDRPGHRCGPNRRRRIGQPSDHDLTRRTIAAKAQNARAEARDRAVRLRPILPVPRRERPVVPVARQRCRRRRGRPRRWRGTNDGRRRRFGSLRRPDATGEDQGNGRNSQKSTHRRTMAARAARLNPKAAEKRATATVTAPAGCSPAFPRASWIACRSESCACPACLRSSGP